MSRPSQDRSPPPRGETAARSKRRFLIGSGIVLAISVASFAVALRPTTQRVYTDAHTINEPASTAAVRDILWEPPVALAQGAGAFADEFEPRLSADGMTLYFVRGKAGDNADLYYAERTPSGWADARPLTAVNTEHDELGPEPSPDGRSLFFYSDRPGGVGSYDIWVVRRGLDGRSTFKEAINLGPGVNSEYNDYGPALAPEGTTLYFASNRPPVGEADQPARDAWPATIREDVRRRTYDLYTAPITDGGFGRAEEVSALNTPHHEGAPAVSPFGDFIYFASNRPGGSGGFDLYRARRLAGGYEPATNLGATVNTSSSELDPALGMGGYALYFSSNRFADEGDPGKRKRYRLFRTTSREVFTRTEIRRVHFDWAAVWTAIGPNLLWALLALLLLLLLLAAARGAWNRQLGLLARCLLASLAAHLLLLLLFNVWEVTATLAREFGRRGRIQIALIAPARGDDITAQVRGEFTNVETPAPSPITSARDPVRLQRQQEIRMTKLAVEHRAIETQPQADAVARPVDASVRLQPEDLPPTTVRLRSPQTPSLTLTLPSEQHRIKEPERVEAEAPVPTLIQSARRPPVRPNMPERLRTVRLASLPTLEGPVFESPIPDSSLSSVRLQHDATIRIRVEPMLTGEIALPGDRTLELALPQALVKREDAAESPDVTMSGAAPDAGHSPIATLLASAVGESTASWKTLDPGCLSQEPTAMRDNMLSFLPKDARPPDPLETLTSIVRDGGPPRAAHSLSLALPTEFSNPTDPFAQRARDQRLAVAKGMGGGEESEQAVQRALRWLAKHQSDDGRWSGDEFDEECGGCGGETDVEVDVALTGLSLLCFLAADHRHDEDGPFRKHVQRGLQWLLCRQESNGDLRRYETMYSQGIATIALAEAYGMTKDAQLRGPVSQAVAFIVGARNRSTGVWRYDPGQPGDTSVLGWQIMALTSAGTAGIDVPAEPFLAAGNWLDRVSSPSKPGLYAYQVGRPSTPSMTAEGLFIRQLLGHRHDQHRTEESIRFILANPPVWDEAPNTYYWYYATLALFHHQGEPWRQWNHALLRELLKHQHKDGRAAGSWDPDGEWARIGGRVYQTALCTLMLEVYYRYLPLFLRERPADAIGTIRGIVQDASTGDALAGATIRLDLPHRPPIAVISGANGHYTLFPSEVPTFFALSAVHDGYLPSSRNVATINVKGSTLTLDFSLEPESAAVVAVEAVPDVHHLGDDHFDGSVNSQFQKRSEGRTYTVFFDLPSKRSLLRCKAAEVALLVKGVQMDHDIIINGVVIDESLDYSPRDGSFGDFTAAFDPALLMAGTNTFEIYAHARGNDIDDFEFVNVQIRLERH